MQRLQIDEETTAGDLKVMIMNMVGRKACSWIKNLQDWALYLPTQTDKYGFGEGINFVW